MTRTKSALAPTNTTPTTSWRRAHLGDLCDQVRQVLQPGSAEAQRRPYLGLENIQSESGQILGVAETGDAGKSMTFAFGPSEVLYGKLRPYLNKVALPDFEGRCTTELIPLRPKTGVDRDFLAWLLRRPETVVAAMQEKTGSRMPRADMDTLMSMEVGVPSEAEQKRIVRELGHQRALLNKAIASSSSVRDALSAWSAASIRASFSTAETASWPLVSIDSISELVIDGPHVTPSYVPRGVPFVTVKNIVSGQLDLSDTRFITEADHAKFCQRGRAEEGDILYTKDGTLGIPCVVEGKHDFSFFVSVALIKLKRDVSDPHYVAFALRSPAVLEQVDRLAAGAGLKHMVLKSIRSVVIPLPSIAKQRVMASRLDALRVKAAIAWRIESARHEALCHLGDRLLERAFVEGAA